MRRNKLSLCFIFAIVFTVCLCFVIQANAYIGGGYPYYTYPYWSLYKYPLGIQNTYGFPGQSGPYGLYGGAYPWWGGGAWGLYGGAYPGRGLYGGAYPGWGGGAYPGWGLYGGLYGSGWW